MGESGTYGFAPWVGKATDAMGRRKERKSQPEPGEEAGAGRQAAGRGHLMGIDFCEMCVPRVLLGQSAPRKRRSEIAKTSKRRQKAAFADGNRANRRTRGGGDCPPHTTDHLNSDGPPVAFCCKSCGAKIQFLSLLWLWQAVLFGRPDPFLACPALDITDALPQPFLLAFFRLSLIPLLHNNSFSPYLANHTRCSRASSFPAWPSIPNRRRFYPTRINTSSSLLPLPLFNPLVKLAIAVTIYLRLLRLNTRPQLVPPTVDLL